MKTMSIKNEEAIVKYITEYYQKTKFYPNFREIAEGVNLSSNATIYSYMNRLEEKGIIIRKADRSSQYRLINQPKDNGWIPCSERMPNKDEYLKNDGRFIVTDGNRIYQSHYDIYDGDFKTVRNVIGNTCDFSIDNCVIAWHPLAEPYIP